MDVTPVPIVIEVSPVQSENASSPMLVTLSGMVIEVTLAVLRTEFPIAAVNAHDYSVFTVTLV